MEVLAPVVLRVRVGGILREGGESGTLQLLRLNFGSRVRYEKCLYVVYFTPSLIHIS